MGKNRGHRPVRTCISCREKKDKDELIRLALDERGLVVWDRSGTRQGRGAYVCSKSPCLERFHKGYRLNNAFRKEGSVRLQTDFMGLEKEE